MFRKKRQKFFDFYIDIKKKQLFQRQILVLMKVYKVCVKAIQNFESRKKTV